MKNQLVMTIRTQKLQTQSEGEEQLELINQNQQKIFFHREAADVARKLIAKDEITVNRYRKLQQEGAVSLLQVEEAERIMRQNQESLQRKILDINQAKSEVKKQQTAYERIMLTPGQTATAEVIIRQRRIIDFFLESFKK